MTGGVFRFLASKKGRTMAGFWDTWATRHRNWRAASTAVVFLLILLWAAVEIRSGKLVETSSDTATVLDVRKHSTASSYAGRGEYGEATVYTGKLLLSDGTTVELLLFSPLPKVGDKMPMIVERYSDGKKYYSIDRQEWQVNGPK